MSKGFEVAGPTVMAIRRHPSVLTSPRVAMIEGSAAARRARSSRILSMRFQMPNDVPTRPKHSPADAVRMVRSNGNAQSLPVLRGNSL